MPVPHLPKGLLHPKSRGDTRPSYPGLGCHRGSSLQYFVLLPLFQGCTSTSSLVASQSLRRFPGGWFQLLCVSQRVLLGQGKLTLHRHSVLNPTVSLNPARPSQRFTKCCLRVTLRRGSITLIIRESMANYIILFKIIPTRHNIYGTGNVF